MILHSFVTLHIPSDGECYVEPICEMW